MIRALTVTFLYLSAFVFIWGAFAIAPELPMKGEWSPIQWIGAMMLIEGCLLKVAGHATLLRLI